MRCWCSQPIPPSQPTCSPRLPLARGIAMPAAISSASSSRIPPPRWGWLDATSLAPSTALAGLVDDADERVSAAAVRGLASLGG